MLLVFRINSFGLYGEGMIPVESELSFRNEFVSNRTKVLMLQGAKVRHAEPACPAGRVLVFTACHLVASNFAESPLKT